MDRNELWRHIHGERAATAKTLADLSPDEWMQASLCTGWTVKDVAAHVIATPQTGWREIFAMTGRNLGRGYNSMIFREVKRLGEVETPESILQDFATYADSRHHVPVTSTVEPLIDALVHHQDILRPLGRSHDMDPRAAAVAADRVRVLSFLMGSRRLIRSVRMEATDVDWARGSGPTVRGPMQELLMLCSGRAAAAELLSGDGVELVPRQ